MQTFLSQGGFLSWVEQRARMLELTEKVSIDRYLLSMHGSQAPTLLLLLHTMKAREKQP